MVLCVCSVAITNWFTNRINVPVMVVSGVLLLLAAVAVFVLARTWMRRRLYGSVQRMSAQLSLANESLASRSSHHHSAGGSSGGRCEWRLCSDKPQLPISRDLILLLV